MLLQNLRNLRNLADKPLSLTFPLPKSNDEGRTLTLTALLPSLSMTIRRDDDLWIRLCRARMSMVDGFPYKEEVGGSSPSAPTSLRSQI